MDAISPQLLSWLWRTHCKRSNADLGIAQPSIGISLESSAIAMPLTRKDVALLALAFIPTAIFVWALLFYPNRDWVILWPREYTTPRLIIFLLGACVAVFVVMGLMLVLRVRETEPLSALQKLALIAFSIVGSLALQVVVTSAAAGSLTDAVAEIVRRTYAAFIGGYWTVGAAVTNVGEFIGQYAERAPSYPVHQSRHPPGLSLIFWASAQVLSLVPGLAAPIANAMRPHSCLGWLSVNAPNPIMAAGFVGSVVEVVLAMLPMLPLFALLKRLAGQRAAVLAVLLYPLLPGFGMWLSQFDRGLALGTITIIYLCERWVAERAARFAVLAGLTLSVCTFLSFGAVPMGLAASIYALARMAQTTPRANWFLWIRPALVAVLGAVLGLASVWLLAWAAFGLNPTHLYHAVFSSHLGIPFPFYPFVLWHPWDAITFMGLPVVTMAAASWRKGAALAAALVGTLVVLSGAHVARGETGRVWFYFAPLAVGACAVVLADRGKWVVVGTFVLLAAQLVVQASVYRVITGYGTPPEKYPLVHIPADATPIDTRFTATGQVALSAYKIDALVPGQRRQITLYWQRLSPEAIDTAFKAFVHVATDENDQTRIASSDAMPADWKYPTTCWQQNQVVADVHPLELSDDAKLGEYPIFVGLYDPATNQRPPTFASPPAQQMHGSVLLPSKAVVVARE